MIRIFEVRCAGDKKEEIQAQLLKKLQIKEKDLLSWQIHRKSIDARRNKISFSFVIDANVKNENAALKKPGIQPVRDEKYRLPAAGKRPLKHRPVVAGFGPAGMFAALILAQAGYCPIVIERGSSLDQRQKDVRTFWQSGSLNPESNVAFGEGGAGAFSDGKLTTRSKDTRVRKVLEELVRHGAKEDILIDQHPHIGSDAFLPVIQSIRETIRSLGGTFYFDSRLDDLEIKDQ
ncbi:MAG: hypothetical protein J6D18_01160, partial [Erysipelotrichaceae bacterium]|nr:hypothetical protein [Erysipelotrichaceae bacterium]